MCKKYILFDFYENEFGELITASDSMYDIKKSAKQYIKDTDGECMLCCEQWNDELNGYTHMMNL